MPTYAHTGMGLVHVQYPENKNLIINNRNQQTNHIIRVQIHLERKADLKADYSNSSNITQNVPPLSSTSTSPIVLQIILTLQLKYM